MKENKTIEDKIKTPNLVTKREGREPYILLDTFSLYKRIDNHDYKQVLKAYMQINNLDMKETCKNLLEFGNYLNDVAHRTGIRLRW